MLIKKLAVGAALALSLVAGACGDDDNDDGPSVGDAGDAGGASDGGTTPPGDGGTGIDAQVGMDGSLPGVDGGGADGSLGDASGNPSGDAGGTLPDGALSNVDAASTGNGPSGNDAASGDQPGNDAASDNQPGDDASTGTTPDAGDCSVNSESFGCGRAVTPTWVRFDNGLEIDRATGLAWAPEVATETDDELKQDCEALSIGGLDNFHIPEIAEVRTLAKGCAETEKGGACSVESGEALPSNAGDCECDAELNGPYEGGRFCRPELPTCDTLWTSTYCGPNDSECATHAHWFYDVATGSIVLAGYETDLAKNAKGRCSSTVPPELIP